MFTEEEISDSIKIFFKNHLITIETLVSSPLHMLKDLITLFSKRKSRTRS